MFQKFLSRHNMQPNTLTRREYRDKIIIKTVRKKSCRILKRIRNQLKSRIRMRIRKKSFQIHNTVFKNQKGIVFFYCFLS